MIWCHACQKETTVSELGYECALCGSSAIQKESQTSSTPNTFQPYIINAPNPAHPPTNDSQEYEEVDIPIQLSIRTMVMESLERPGQFMVVRYISSSFGGLEPTRNPVSKQTLDGLEKVEQIQECSVCQEEGGSGLRLKCSHCFHEHCLKPWLEQTNTCPSCRQQVE